MYLKREAQLSQLKFRYQQVWDHLSSAVTEGSLAATECVYPECE
jgi:hypothetical protein